MYLVMLVCNGGLTVFAPLRGKAGTGGRLDGLSLIKLVLMETAMYWGRSVPTERSKRITHTHTHTGFSYFLGTFQRHNDFYTVQTVYSIPKT